MVATEGYCTKRNRRGIGCRVPRLRFGLVCSSPRKEDARLWRFRTRETQPGDRLGAILGAFRPAAILAATGYQTGGPEQGSATGKNFSCWPDEGPVSKMQGIEMK